MTKRIEVEAVPASASQGEIDEQVRARAYERYEKRGREHGNDLADWLLAEAEVLGKTDVLKAA